MEDHDLVVLNQGVSGNAVGIGVLTDGNSINLRNRSIKVIGKIRHDPPPLHVGQILGDLLPEDLGFLRGEGRWHPQHDFLRDAGHVTNSQHTVILSDGRA